MFQTGNNKIDICVQYEKKIIINGVYTVSSTFYSLVEVLKQMEVYRQLIILQAKIPV